jgi:hypothetical protein
MDIQKDGFKKGKTKYITAWLSETNMGTKFPFSFAILSWGEEDP